MYLARDAGGWYDFWTGDAVAAATHGTATISAPAPFDAIPRACARGIDRAVRPELQWTDEKPSDPVTLVVYAGADGAFTLYDDDGASYDYERGAFSRIPLRWSEATRTLSIGRREGSFPGMLAERTFQIVIATRARPVPFSFDPKPDKIIRYRGDAVAVSFAEGAR